MMGLKETVAQMANWVRWYWHMLRRDDGHDLRKALEFEVKGKRKWERPKKNNVEDASGEGEQECWFGEGGCLGLSEMESGSWRDWY